MSLFLSIRNYTHTTAAERACMRAAREEGAPVSRCGAATWTTWSLVDFRYRRHDTLGYLFAVSSFLPLVVVIFLAGFASAPSPHRVPALVLLLCLILNTASNTALKSVLRQPRPPHPTAREENYSTVHGMPSDHAQFITFFVAYLALRSRRGGQSGRRRGGPRQRSSGSTRHTDSGDVATAPPPLSVPMCLFFAAAALTVMAGRVYNGYHTVEQVAVGSAIGAGAALVCSRAVVQRVLVMAAERVMLPLMFACTGWTALI